MKKIKKMLFGGNRGVVILVLVIATGIVVTIFFTAGSRVLAHIASAIGISIVALGIIS